MSSQNNALALGWNNRVISSLPPQKVSESTRNSKKWKELCVNSIIGMANARGALGRSPRQNKAVNYDLVNSRFKQSDFINVLNPYGVTDTKWVPQQKIQNYNLIRPKIETLKGEEMKMGLNIRCVSLNGEAISEKQKQRTQAINQAIAARATDIATGNLDEEGNPKSPSPQEVAEAFDKNFVDPTEVINNRLLKFIIQNDGLRMKFSKGWEHGIISSEEVYYVHIADGHVSTRVCNPLNIAFDREQESPYIHDGDWAMEERWMPVGSVIDLYGEHLSDDLVRRLDEGLVGGGYTNGGQFPGYMYYYKGGTAMTSNKSQDTSHVYVANVVWRSYIKEGKLSFISERSGKVEHEIVDSSFKLTPEMEAKGWKVSWYWKTIIMQGTRIGMNDFVDVRPLDNQTGRLPYVGYIYNNLNSVATSMVDMIKPHQYTYLIVWYRLEQELAKAKGKKFVMDLAQLPKSKGWSVDQWMHYFDQHQVAWVNSLEEGREGDPNSISKFNQFTAIDMSLSQVVSQYMEVLRKLEEQVDRIAGVSPQREGDIGTNETATGAQRSIIQSTNNTRPMFFYHNHIMKIVLEECLELAKVAYADGLDTQYAIDENTVEVLKINAGQLNGTDLGVFLIDSFEENESIMKLDQLLEVALQTDKAQLSDIVGILGTKSMSEIRSTIAKGEQAKFERDQQAQEAQNQALKESEAIKKGVADEKNAVEREKIAAQIYIAELGKSGETIDTAKQAADAAKAALENRKQDHIESKDKAAAELARDSLDETKRSNKTKEQIARSKPITTTKK